MLVLNIGLLILALAIILLGTELFTNALEHLGARLCVSEGVVGSVFAAVATALPETLVPVIAVFFGDAAKETREHIGIGSILGPSLMLVSLAFTLIGIFAGLKRGWFKPLKPEFSGVMRDLKYFLIAYGIALISLFLPVLPGLHIAIGLLLVAIYIFYIYHTMRASNALVEQGHCTKAEIPLLFKRIGIPHTLLWEMSQLIAGFILIIVGAKMFVQGVVQVGLLTGVSVLILSLVIIPVATEMPEKFNSITWTLRRKDTLAFGNVTGAMVFQGALLPAFGMQLGAWGPNASILWAMSLTIVAALWLMFLTARHRLTPINLLFNGLAYVVFFITLFL